MTISDDVAKALNAIINAQTILDTLEKESEAEYVDPAILTTQEIRAIKNRLDLPKEDLTEVHRRLERLDEI